MVAFNRELGRPAWLSRNDLANKNSLRGQRYYRHLWNAQPQWADVGRIRRIYDQARAERRNGRDVEVDHIVPLVHPHVCGLHVPDNLRIIDRLVNAKKSNYEWPDMPMQQGHLFEQYIAPADFSLEQQP